MSLRFKRNIDANLARQLPLFVDKIIEKAGNKKKESYIQKLDSVIDRQDNDSKFTMKLTVL